MEEQAWLRCGEANPNQGLEKCMAREFHLNQKTARRHKRGSKMSRTRVCNKHRHARYKPLCYTCHQKNGGGHRRGRIEASCAYIITRG